MSTVTKRQITRSIAVASVLSLVDLLGEVCRSPGSFAGDASIIQALKSQGALAKYSADERGIRTMSLNYQRSIAILAIGSFEKLDRERLRAKSALSAAMAPPARKPTGRKVDLLTRIRDLEEDNQTLRQDLFLLQIAYDKRCTQARSYAAAAGAKTLERAIVEQRELESMFSFSQRTERPSNVVQHSREGRRDHLT